MTIGFSVYTLSQRFDFKSMILIERLKNLYRSYYTRLVSLPLLLKKQTYLDTSWRKSSIFNLSWYHLRKYGLHHAESSALMFPVLFLVAHRRRPPAHCPSITLPVNFVSTTTISFDMYSKPWTFGYKNFGTGRLRSKVWSLNIVSLSKQNYTQSNNYSLSKLCSSAHHFMPTYVPVSPGLNVSWPIFVTLQMVQQIMTSFTTLPLSGVANDIHGSLLVKDRGVQFGGEGLCMWRTW